MHVGVSAALQKVLVKKGCNQSESVRIDGVHGRGCVSSTAEGAGQERV